MNGIEAKLGQAASEADRNPAIAGEGGKPVTDEVAGQNVSMNANIYVCPQCWAMNDVALDTIRTGMFSCWNCGGYFDI